MLLQTKLTADSHLADIE